MKYFGATSRSDNNSSLPQMACTMPGPMGFWLHYNIQTETWKQLMPQHEHRMLQWRKKEWNDFWSPWSIEQWNELLHYNETCELHWGFQCFTWELQHLLILHMSRDIISRNTVTNSIGLEQESGLRLNSNFILSQRLQVQVEPFYPF